MCRCNLPSIICKANSLKIHIVRLTNYHFPTYGLWRSWEWASYACGSSVSLTVLKGQEWCPLAPVTSGFPSLHSVGIPIPTLLIHTWSGQLRAAGDCHKSSFAYIIFPRFFCSACMNTANAISCTKSHLLSLKAVS